MRVQLTRAVTGLVVAGALLVTPVVGVLAQDHPDAMDAPHPLGVVETELGAAAAACEVPIWQPATGRG